MTNNPFFRKTDEVSTNADWLLIIDLWRTKAIGEIVTFDEMKSICHKIDEITFKNSIQRAKNKLHKIGRASCRERV